MKPKTANLKLIDFDEPRLKVAGSSCALKVVSVPIEHIKFKYEQEHDSVALEELAESISEYGIMHPVSLRRTDSEDKQEYEIISGIRRVRAARLAGVSVIPAIIYEISADDFAIMSLLERLRRENLHFIEEAEMYYLLMMEYGMTQEELAYRVGKSQSTIANKIRLLKLPPLVKKIIQEHDLSERHARALLRIRDEQLQLRALKTVCSKNFNVSKTEQLVGKLLERKISPSHEARFSALEAELSGDPYQIMMCEIKAFINDLRKDVDGLRRAGIITKAAQFDRDEYLEFIVRIPKAENGMKKRAQG